jgi:hypothetical protein
MCYHRYLDLTPAPTLNHCDKSWQLTPTVGQDMKIQFIEIDDIRRLLHEDSSSTIDTQELDDFLRHLIFDEPPIWVQIRTVQIELVKQGKFPYLYCYFSTVRCLLPLKLTCMFASFLCTLMWPGSSRRDRMRPGRLPQSSSGCGAIRIAYPLYAPV